MTIAAATASATTMLSHPFLSDVEDGRKNNLNLIRFVLASAVVLSHCYVLLNQFSIEPMQRWLHFNDLGGTAVLSFFFLSGHLIFKSALHSDPAHFVYARALRIFPALIAAALACTFVLGPLLTTLDPVSYFSDWETWRYLSTTFLVLGSMRLPGVFEGGSVNQPLWTLPAEWVLYALLLLVCVGSSLLRKRSLPASTWAVIAFTLMFTLLLFPLPWVHAWKWMAVALAGAASYAGRRFIPLSIPVLLLLIVLDVCALLTVPLAGKVLFPVMLGYALLVIGFHPRLHVSWMHRVGDYSYGVYIFAWPFQQILLPYASTPELLFVLSYPCGLWAAVLSWHFIESPSLKLKAMIRRRDRVAALDQNAAASSNKVAI